MLRNLTVWLCIAAASTVPSPSDARELPLILFDVPLGAKFTFPEEIPENPENMPIKRFAGVKKFLGNGIHFYFEPLREHKSFPYIENRESASDEYYKTSFRLYLLPIIPEETGSLSELDDLELKWEVAVIEWSDITASDDDGYYWAKEMCDTFKLDFTVAPEITDYYESNWYECTFNHENREFSISSLAGPRIKLSYAKDFSEAKNDAIGKKLKELKLEQIRPY